MLNIGEEKGEKPKLKINHVLWLAMEGYVGSNVRSFDSSLCGCESFRACVCED